MIFLSFLLGILAGLIIMFLQFLFLVIGGKVMIFLSFLLGILTGLIIMFLLFGGNE